MTGVPFDEKVNAYDWFLKNVNQLENERTRALFKALKPIQWDWSSSIRARQNLVTERFRTVNTILPFLTKTEKKLVKEWKKENNSSELWD
jgi:hypothetical protein